MTSSALMFPPHLNENPPQKTGVKHPSYTTDNHNLWTLLQDELFQSCHILFLRKHSTIAFIFKPFHYQKWLK